VASRIVYLFQIQLDRLGKVRLACSDDLRHLLSVPDDRPLSIENSAFVERVIRFTVLVRDQAGPEKMCL